MKKRGGKLHAAPKHRAGKVRNEKNPDYMMHRVKTGRSKKR